ncbi:hypothetical protein J2D78_01460 [Microbacterium maritypicum]|uniref:hypothetical protein n=1 Tax=Microbacterium maritypicum TaxID=33918 RepID=UPI001B320D75|nr:hypothetical protein [Microbacterium liquefaciens]MBP5800742.1 hypothetical protein [Microbacterium liquefaciens]
MWPDVDTADITDRWRPLSPEEEITAPQRIADAQAELNTALRLRGLNGTPTFETAGELADWQTLYIATVVASVRRYFLNPDGWTEERESLDDYDASRKREAGSGNLYFVEADIDRLVPRSRQRRGAFTIRLGQT